MNSNRPTAPWWMLSWVFLALASCGTDDSRTVPETGYRGWPVRGGSPGGERYSALRQIDRSNVHELEVAWTYDSGDAHENSEMQCNPIVRDGVLFATTPRLNVIALDAASGKERWRFDPWDGAKPKRRYRNRGVAYWTDGDTRRVFVTVGPRLIALDAANGRPASGFGKDGVVDLRYGLGRDPKTLTVSSTSPGTVFEDLLILGSTVGEALPAAPGHVRAYDVKTGNVRWIFRTIPRPGEPGHETWPADAWTYIGGANCWSGSTLDAERGLVYVPTGSAAFDFYGANRKGDNLYANCLLCLDARTGKRVWHFQFVKHDVWDRDLPTPPTLVTVRRDGALVDAVAQPTKSGHVFVFEREKGTPLFPIEEIEVAASDAPGELLAKTQRLPKRPPPFARQQLTQDLLTQRTPDAAKAARERLAKLRSGPQFTPPSTQGTVLFPGFDGGAEWGGAAFDKETGLLYVNANEMAWILRLVERRAFGKTDGKQLYLKHCASCHREDFAGTPPAFPGIENLAAKYTVAEVTKLSREGAGRMAGLPHLSQQELDAISEYVVNDKIVPVQSTTAASPIDLPYRHDGYNRFVDGDGYPAIAPPWGTLSAIDLDQGEIRWQIPFGEFPELAAKGVPTTGTENYGGPVVTAGGLIFIAATNHDAKIRAFDKATGKQLWEAKLPASGNATPAVYEAGGRQFVVIGAGGGKSGRPSGSTYVAFALPRR